MKGRFSVTGIRSIKKQTDNNYINMYKMEAERRDGGTFEYFMVSRKKRPEDFYMNTKKLKADGVLIYGIYGENRDKVVLVRQYRYPINGYIYEFPAGLVEEGESARDTAVREAFEETGMEFEPLDVNGCYEKPFFTTVGMTDETCSAVYGYYKGTPSSKNITCDEDIEVVVADRDECRRILKEENVAVMCAYMLMHFINSKGDPLEFLKAADKT